MIIRILAAAELLLLLFNLALGWISIDPWLNKDWLEAYTGAIETFETSFALSPVFLIIECVQMLFLFSAVIAVILISTRARYIYLIALLTSTPFAFMSPFYITSPPLALIDTISAMISGAILALLFIRTNAAEQGAAANPYPLRG